jgi:hypothetical protein
VCANIWITLQDPIYGLKRPESPFDSHKARMSPICNQAWTDTEARMGGLEAFLRTLTPLHLADADGGQAFVPKDAAAVARGKTVFAEQCARCHSSKRAPQGSEAAQIEWYREAVMMDDFLDNNFLSTTRVIRSLRSEPISDGRWAATQWPDTYGQIFPPTPTSSFLR